MKEIQKSLKERVMAAAPIDEIMEALMNEYRRRIIRCGKELARLLEKNGWELKRIKGSRHLDRI